jgi:nucleotide-binding universal stress UspA family protein
MELMAREAEKVERDGQARATEVITGARSLLSRMGAGEVEAAEIVSGDAKTVILDEAKQWNADLVVLGSHGWHGVDRFMMGSVSEAVAMHAPCSVEIIR